jgi:hypothetical protein
MITLKFIKGNDGLMRMFIKYPNYVGGICYAKDFRKKDLTAQELINEIGN